MSEIEAARAVPREDGLEALFARAFASVEPGRLVLATIPAPVAPPELFLTAKDEDAFLFTRGPRAQAGSGALATFEAEGQGRFASIRDQARAALSRLVEVVHPFAAFAPSPRAFGGFAFSRAVAPGVWDGFPAAAFSIPRFTYARGLEGAVLQVAVDPARDKEGALVAEVMRVLARLGTAAEAEDEDEDEGSSGAPKAAIEREPDAAAWAAGIEGALSAMQRGELEKVVLARATRVSFAEPIDVRRVASRLAASDERTLRFAVRRAGATFLGATPERLISKERDAFSADALAGSSSASAVADLFHAKSTHEHAVVVRYILERLTPHASELLAEVAPSVVRAGHLRHLFTPIRGRARRGVHLLDLAAAIHPTPAVCGVPVEPARAAIARFEQEPRGWYAGAVGWFDAAGDGELSVALRSGLIRGRTAHLYAGAGIVEGSRADDEWAEINMKERVMLRALGAEA